MTAPSPTTPERPPLVDSGTLIRSLGLVATLIAVGVLMDVLGIRTLLQAHWVDNEIRGNGLLGAALLVLVGAVTTAIGLPRQVPTFLAGYAFGFVSGAAVGLLATVLGAAITFHYARFMGRPLLARRFPQRIRRIDAFLSRNTLTMALILRLAPIGSNLIANLAAGVSGVRAAPFFAGSIIGYLPQTVIFALLGSGFAIDPAIRTSISIVLLIATSMLGVWLWRRTRQQGAQDPV